MFSWTFFFTLAPVIVFLFVMGLFMPEMTRKGIVFGVRIPAAHVAHPEIVKLRQSYKKSYGAVGGILAVGVISVFAIMKHPAPCLIGIAVQMAALYAFFFTYRSRLLALKDAGRFHVDENESIVIDTRFRQQTYSISWKWFLLPLAVIAVNAIAPLLAYDSIPERLPFHWNAAGQVDTWVNKTRLVVESMPLFMVAITVIMMFSLLVIRSAKQEIRAEDPETSSAQSRLFRYRWSKYLIVSNVLVLAVFSIFNVKMLGFVNWSFETMMYATLGLIFATLLYSIIIMFTTGQGGERISLRGGGKAGGNPRNDDRFYKMGLFYYNPDDPSIWVEKRYGIGWTLNFGNKISWIIMAGLILFIAAIPTFSGYLVKGSMDRQQTDCLRTNAEPIAANLIDGLKTRDFEKTAKDFSQEMRTAVNPQGASSNPQGLFFPELGTPDAYRFEKVESKGGYAAVVYRVDFTLEKDVKMRLVFLKNDPEYKIQGLWFDSPKLRESKGK